MKAVVFGYHNMGVLGISKLLSHGFKIPLVFTHEDSEKENIWFKSVTGLCRSCSLEYVTPESPNTPDFIEHIRATGPDIIFSFYYRLMIAKEILHIPRLGAYNLHGSLLPAYRGRCPVNWVIIKGEERSGVTLHEMVEKPDAGAIVAQESVAIAPDDTAVNLFHHLEAAPSRMLDEILPQIRQGNIPKVPQDLSQGSYFGGRKPEDGKIAWYMSAREIYNLIRGVTRPYPGAFGLLGDQRVIFWWARVSEEEKLSPGMIHISDNQVLIGTGRGALVPLEVEANGKVYKDHELTEYFKPYQGECMK